MRKIPAALNAQLDALFGQKPVIIVKIMEN
jgi:hypothetical protein